MKINRYVFNNLFILSVKTTDQFLRAARILVLCLLILFLAVFLTACQPVTTEAPSSSELATAPAIATPPTTQTQSPSLAIPTASPTNTNVSTPTRTVFVTWTPRPTSTILPSFATPTPSVTPRQILPLNHVGPWIFDDLSESVYSLDGGSAELDQLELAEDYNHCAIAPQDGWLAIKTGIRNNSPWNPEAEYELLLYHLPNNRPVQRILLLGNLGKETVRQAVDQETLDPSGSAVINSLIFEDNMLWSSNALYLAFAGALDGPSSDIYLYDTVSNSIQRLTSEEDQVVLMSWSPDDREIIYATAEQLFDDGFHALHTVWAVDVESGEITSLYSARAGQERIFGWINSDTFIVGARGFEDPSWGLSRIKITQPGLQPIMDGYFDDVDVDPSSGTTLVEINGFFWQPTIPKGIYRLDYKNGQKEILYPGENLNLWGWLPEINAFDIYDSNTEQVVFLSPNGEIMLTLPMPGGGFYRWPVPSPDGQYIVIGGTSIYTITGQLITAWTGSRILSWLPDSSGVISGDCSQGFFEIRSSANDWRPVRITTIAKEYCNYRIVP